MGGGKGEVDRIAGYLLGLLSSLTPREVEEHVKRGTDLAALLDDRLRGPQRTLAQLYLRSNWSRVEHLLTRPDEIRRLLRRHRPDIAEIFYTDPDAIRWLNQQAEKLYRLLYRIAWQE